MPSDRALAKIAQFLSERGCSSSDDGALRMAVFYADGALTRATSRWRYSAELTAAGVAADFRGVNVAASFSELVQLVAAHSADLGAIRSQLLSRALPPDRCPNGSSVVSRDDAVNSKENMTL